MKMDEDLLLLMKCLSEVEKKSGWGDSTLWTNRHYTDLSEQVLQVTDISLSVSSNVLALNSVLVTPAAIDVLFASSI